MKALQKLFSLAVASIVVFSLAGCGDKKKKKSKKEDNKKSKKSKKKNCRDTDLYFRRNAMEYSESNSSDYDDDLYFRQPLNNADVRKSFFDLLFG